MNLDVENRILESLARTDEAQKSISHRLTKIEVAMEKQASIMEAQAESRILIKEMRQQIANLEAKIYTQAKEAMKLKTGMAFMLGSGVAGAGVVEILKAIL